MMAGARFARSYRVDGSGAVRVLAHASVPFMNIHILVRPILVLSSLEGWATKMAHPQG